MKKFLILILTTFSLNAYAFDFDNYKYLENGIYYKKGSLKFENNRRTAEFKIVSDSTYEINKYMAYCDQSNGLKIMSAKLYNSNNASLEEFITSENYAYSDYTGLVNGQIYYNFICGKKVNF